MPDQIQRTKVESSNFNLVEYNKTQETLKIYFNSGFNYVYFGVPEDIVLQLLKAESKGEYFHKYIRYEYPYKKVK